MRPTLDDVAKLAGVSPSTVSRTLSGNIKVSDEKRQRVWQAVKELGYQPDVVARGLRSGQTHILGLVVPDIRNPFFADLIRGAEDVATERGYTLFVGSTDEDRGREDTYLKALISYRPTGLMLSSSRGREIMQRLKRHDLPAVLLGRGLGDRPPNWVGTDHHLGAAMAARYLVSLGHKRLGMITGPSDIDVYVLRREGFLSVLPEHGLMASVKEGYRHAEGGYMGMTEFLALDTTCRPTAVFAASDTLAIGAMRAAIEAGLSVPGDVSVMGFDGLELGSFVTPRLTTMSQSGYQIGFLGCRRLLEFIDERSTSYQPIILKPSLVVRESTAPPKV